jgi:hypothetical protein
MKFIQQIKMFIVLHTFNDTNILPTCCMLPLIGFLGVILVSKIEFVEDGLKQRLIKQ